MVTLPDSSAALRHSREDWEHKMLLLLSQTGPKEAHLESFGSVGADFLLT